MVPGDQVGTGQRVQEDLEDLFLLEDLLHLENPAHLDLYRQMVLLLH